MPPLFSLWFVTADASLSDGFQRLNKSSSWRLEKTLNSLFALFVVVVAEAVESSTVVVVKSHQIPDLDDTQSLALRTSSRRTRSSFRFPIEQE
ncbi:hypothetical protein F5Y12DRAFT_709842 [Xylaria sp. FL1777]|nr:hypothetical protein F5Y12DRAFT_709842 [Xylaria sp. FL1777]